MSRSSRTLNRMLLALLGTAWLALGAVVVLWHVRPDLVHAALSPVAATAASVDWTIVATAAGTALVLLAAVLRRGMGLGVAYGIWGALGVASTALLSALLYDEPLTPVMGLGLVLIIGGVLLVEGGSQAALGRRDPVDGSAA